MPTTYTIPNGRTVMDATTYTGTGTTLTVNNKDSGTTGFKPDMIWWKSRSGAYNHAIQDSVRGLNNIIFPNLTNGEGNYPNSLDSFNSNGFTLGSNSGYPVSNNNGSTYVAWQWQAGQGTTSSNTQGSITSTVSANTTAGFSIVTYTTPASGLYTVGHGLGVAPQLIINKCRGNTGNWLTWHIGLSGGSANINSYMVLNLTDAQATSGSQIWVAPTSTTFGINGSIAVTPSTTYVAYCWAQIAGFSQFGSYTGNGSTDGPFIYTGFRPRWIMIKRTDDTYSWWINDSARDPRNVVGQDLAANLSDAESSDAPVQDFLSNGFKLRTSAYPGFNANGGTYIYACFAENPFKFANAR